MPIYEYHCEDCSTDFQELVLSRGAEVDVVCNKCQSSNITRLLSGVAVKTGSSSSPSSPGPQSSGGGCGGHCSCH